MSVTECEEYGLLTKDLNVQCDNVDPGSSGNLSQNEFPHIVSTCNWNVSSIVQVWTKLLILVTASSVKEVDNDVLDCRDV